MQHKQFLARAVVVAQLVERSLPTPDVRGSNPLIGNLLQWTFIFFTVNCIEKTKIKKKRPEMPPPQKKEQFLANSGNCEIISEQIRIRWAAAAMAPWFRLRLPSCGPGIKSKHSIYAFIKRKCHCTADLLFDWFGFTCFAHVQSTTDLLVRPTPHQSNRRLASDTSPYEVSFCSLLLFNL